MFFNKISYFYKNFIYLPIYLKIIAIYIALYLGFVIIDFFFETIGLFLYDYLSLNSFFFSLLKYPWTLITHGFFHKKAIHLILNAFFLVSLSQLFLLFFSQKLFLKVYFIGILGSSLFYMVGVNVLVSMGLTSHKCLYGSSGAVMAILFALVAYCPNRLYGIAFLGKFPLKYIALVILLLSFSDVGGNLSHIGGALGGYLYMRKIQTNYSFHVPFLTYFLNRFKRKKSKTPNKILNKIYSSGYESLNKKEKNIIFKRSK